MTIKEINTNTKEGRLLIAALGALTVSPDLRVNGEEVDGRQVTPDDMLNRMLTCARRIYDTPVEECDYTTDKVAEMMKTYGQTVRTEPSEITVEEKRLSINLILEEVKELAEAMGQSTYFTAKCAGIADTYRPHPDKESDLVEVLDALADIRVVADGTTNRYGMASIFKAAFDDVHNSNMSKTFDNDDDANTFAISYSEDAYVAEPSPGVFVVKKASDNKVIKPPHYTPANPAQFL